MNDTHAPVATGFVRIATPGWVWTDHSVARLEHQLRSAPANVAALLADTTPVPAGSSYLTHGERLATRPLGAVTSRPGGPVVGLALVRASLAEGDQDVDLTGHTVLVDHGAHAHDPSAPRTSLGSASALGRPPFPWRPVLAFVATTPLGDRAEPLLVKANELLALDVEARLLLTEDVAGDALVVPCRAERSSLEVLRPDVVVALDADARSLVEADGVLPRGTVLIDGSDASRRGAELVSWRLGRSAGRLRARTGDGLPPRELAALVRRLCTGPHPMPPSLAVDGAEADDGTERSSTARTPVRPPRRRQRLAVGTTSLEAAARRRSVGLAAWLAAAGDKVDTGDPSDWDLDRAAAADVLVLQMLDGATVLGEVLDRRRAAGKPTVVDLTAADVVTGPDGVGLAQPTAHLVERAGLALAATGRALALLERTGAGLLTVPTLVTPDRQAALARARIDGPGMPGLRLAWYVGEPGTRGWSQLDALAVAVAELLADRTTLELEIYGDPFHLPAPLLNEPRVRVVPGLASPAEIGAWSALLWTPDPARLDLRDDPVLVAEAGLAGVPTVAATSGIAAEQGLIAPDLAVPLPARIESWLDTLRLVLDDPWARGQLATETTRRMVAVAGPAASVRAAGLLVAWALGHRP